MDYNMSDIKIYNQAIKRGMPASFARLMCGQARHETANYTHKFYTQYNNAFGYSYYKDSSWQLSTGGTTADNGGKIARYANVENSVNEVVSWVLRRQKDKGFPTDLGSLTPTTYAEWLRKCNYFTDTAANYGAGIAAGVAKLPAELKSATTEVADEKKNRC
jgi:hypothetical protein